MSRGLGHRVAALGMLASAGVVTVLLGGTGAASAQEPDVTAWWNAANAGDPAPAPPPPPDVADGDLLVQGSNAGPAGSPAAGAGIGAAPLGTQAVAGLLFDLQPTDIVGALTLTVDGDPPPQVSVVACRATERFSSAQNGPWKQVPPYDGDACVQGKLDGDDVVFAGVTKLVVDSRLAVVLLPGPLDRVVFKAPDDSALAVEDGSGVGAAAPPVGSGTAAAPGGGGSSSGGNVESDAPVGGSSVAAPPSSGSSDLPGAATTGSGDAETPPVVAGPDQSAPAAEQQARSAAVDDGLSTRARRAIALAVIGLEILGYALLMRRPGEAAPVAGVATAGGRLRAPDRWTGSRGGWLAEGGARTGGVGRFRRDRQGPAPRL